MLNDFFTIHSNLDFTQLGLIFRHNFVVVKQIHYNAW